MGYKNPDQQREYQREWARKNSAKRRKARHTRKRDILSELKSKPCMDCGNTFPVVCMDFDHRPGEEKLATVNDFVRKGWGIKKMLEEIDKCDLVCSNCHRVRTATRGGYI